MKLRGRPQGGKSLGLKSWKTSTSTFLSNLIASVLCMSPPCEIITKKVGHNCVCTIRYEVHRVKNVRGDGPVLFGVSRAGPE